MESPERVTAQASSTQIRQLTHGDTEETVRNPSPKIRLRSSRARLILRPQVDVWERGRLRLLRVAQRGALQSECDPRTERRMVEFDSKNAVLQKPQRICHIVRSFHDNE